MIDWHRRRGHAIVLVSGTLAPLARAVGTLLTESAGNIRERYGIGK